MLYRGEWKIIMQLFGLKVKGEERGFVTVIGNWFEVQIDILHPEFYSAQRNHRIERLVQKCNDYLSFTSGDRQSMMLIPKGLRQKWNHKQNFVEYPNKLCVFQHSTNKIHYQYLLRSKL